MNSDTVMGRSAENHTFTGNNLAYISEPDICVPSKYTASRAQNERNRCVSGVLFWSSSDLVCAKCPLAMGIQSMCC